MLKLIGKILLGYAISVVISYVIVYIGLELYIRFNDGPALQALIIIPIVGTLLSFFIYLIVRRWLI